MRIVVNRRENRECVNGSLTVSTSFWLLTAVVEVALLKTAVPISKHSVLPWNTDPFFDLPSVIFHVQFNTYKGRERGGRASESGVPSVPFHIFGNWGVALAIGKNYTRNAQIGKKSRRKIL